MHRFFASSILNLGLRSLSMLAKFLLVIYIGKYLSVEDLGEYGLFITTITIAIYFLGLDFYTYNTREILAKEKVERLPLIRDQFVFHLIVYSIVLPTLLTIFAFDIIKKEYIVFFYFILVFEHISQELYRLFTTLKRPLFANFLLFIRTGMWVYILILLWQMEVSKAPSLISVWYSWIIGSFLSVIIGILYLQKEYNFKTLTKEIDWIWIKTGLKVSMPFFIGTLAYKVIEFSDRYMIDFYMTKADVGIYTFFGSIANTINIIVFTLVIMIYYPLLVEQYQNNQMSKYKQTLKEFFLKTLTISLGVSIALLLLIQPVLEYIDKTELQQSISILWLLIISNVILNVSLVPHYNLYARKKDLQIRNATIAGALANILLNIIFIKSFGLQGAAISTILSFVIILILKVNITNRVNI